MRTMPTAALVAILASPGPAQTPTAPAVKQGAYVRVALAHAIASDPGVRKAVIAKNAEGEPLSLIQRRDREWSSAPARRSAFTTGPCPDRLREMIKDDALIVEVILMDERGANVCLSRETSDYWQGDEAKWKKTFVDGSTPSSTSRPSTRVPPPMPSSSASRWRRAPGASGPSRSL